jgi:hypothetical protein
MAMASSTPMPTKSRIRRNREDPVFGKAKFRTTTTLIVPHPSETLELRLHRSRWESDPDLPGVHHRVLRARLCVDGTHAGSFKLTEIRPTPLISRDSFFDWADAQSEQMAVLGEVICGHWEEVSDVSDFGTILELTRAWMHPSFSKGGRFALAASSLIASLDDWVLLILKAFPLEYEGQASDQFNAALRRRHHAMMKLYRTTLKVASFPGNAGAEGWMFAIKPGAPIDGPVTCDWDGHDIP